MENLSQVNESARFPVHLPAHSYLQDHRFEGRAVLPAVEAMQAITRAVKHFRPDTDITALSDAHFDRFLYLAPGLSRLDALIDIKVHENGDITAALLSRSTSKKGDITRVKEHVTLCFPALKPGVPDPPLDLISALEGICFEIPSENIYRDLVPFGPSYQNLITPLLLSGDGAIARTYARPVPGDEGNAPLLGSSFPLDASFHAACAWGQRYAGTVAFPVGVEKRVLFRRTSPGCTYISRILPSGVEQGVLDFDIWIYDESGELYEVACNVHMRDVSAGRMRPPQWVIDQGSGASLEGLGGRCGAFVVVELKAVLPFAEKALSDLEKSRMQRMKEARRKSYLAARMACKRLCRRLNQNDLLTPANDITTISSDRIRPCCPVYHGDPPVHCSVSHDDRFCVAAADHNRVGVDVERISQRVLKSTHVFMSESERLLVGASALGEAPAALRIWTIKEAVTKAFGLTLAESWNRVRVSAVGALESSFLLDGKVQGTAFHKEVGPHLFTLVSEEKRSGNGEDRECLDMDGED